MRLFLDSNIVFSAALSDGAIRRLLNDLRSAGHVLVINGYVWEEARRNLQFYRTAALKELHRLALKIEIHMSVTPSTHSAELLSVPEKDRPIIAATGALSCKILITGDRTHFGIFFGKIIFGVEILSPSGAAQTLL